MDPSAVGISTEAPPHDTMYLNKSMSFNMNISINTVTEVKLSLSLPNPYGARFTDTDFKPNNINYNHIQV